MAYDRPKYGGAVMKIVIRQMIAGIFLLISLHVDPSSLFAVENPETPHTHTLKVWSKAFDYGDKIPSRFTCDGEDISPDLAWSGAPGGTQSYAVIADDPDAPNGMWVHWVIYNIPLPVTNLPPALPRKEMLANGELQGQTDFGRVGYGGPCPPSGTHRYFFKVYALDSMLDFKPGASKAEIELAMEGHVLAQGELMGKYQRKKA